MEQPAATVEPLAEPTPVELSPNGHGPIVMEPTPQVEAEPVVATVTEPVVETQIEAAPQIEVDIDAAPQATRFRVVIRLSGAEPVEAGAFDGVGDAKNRALEIVGQLTSEDGSWPYFRGRFLRPDAIVSVDIVEETAW